MNSHEQAGATLRSLTPGRFVGQRHEVRMPWPRRRPGRGGTKPWSSFRMRHVVCCLQLVAKEIFQRWCVELEFRTHRGPTKLDLFCLTLVHSLCFVEWGPAACHTLQAFVGFEDSGAPVINRDVPQEAAVMLQ